MGFNVFRGDNRTFAVIVIAPAADRELRALRHEAAWQAACAAIAPLDLMTSDDYARPITGLMPMGGLMNVDRTGDPGVAGIVAVGDAFCHTDPAFAYGLSFSLLHAQLLAQATADADAVAERFRADAGPEARERYALACETDAARAARWRGEPLDIRRREAAGPAPASPGPPREELLAHIAKAMSSASHAGQEGRGRRRRIPPTLK